MQPNQTKQVRKTEIIDLPSDNLCDLTGHFLQDRFQVEELLYQGNQSYVFAVTDSQKQKEQKNKLVVKFCSECHDLTNEVKTLVQLRKF